MKWTRVVEHIREDEPIQPVWHAESPATLFTASGPSGYRIFERHDSNMEHYRIEYQLETGWWPVGKAKKLQYAKQLAEEDVMGRLKSPPNSPAAAPPEAEKEK